MQVAIAPFPVYNVYIRTHHGTYLHATHNGDVSHKNEAQVWEIRFVPDHPGHVTLRSCHGKFMTAEKILGFTGAVTCNRTEAHGWEKWHYEQGPSGTFFVKGDHGKFLSAHNGGSVKADTTNRGEHEQFLMMQPPTVISVPPPMAVAPMMTAPPPVMNYGPPPTPVFTPPPPVFTPPPATMTVNLGMRSVGYQFRGKKWAEGARVILTSCASKRSLRIKPDGFVDGEGQAGQWAQFIVHRTGPDTVKLQNVGNSAHWLRIENGNLDGNGQGGPLCDFRILKHAKGTYSLRSAADPSCGVGLAFDGTTFPARFTGLDNRGQFHVQRIG